MAYAVERAIKNDVLRARWLGYMHGKSHAFLIPEGDLPEGKIRAVCPGSFATERLEVNGGERCKTCAAMMADDTRKRGTGLSETQVDQVATGSVHGTPASAERVRAAEISLISGDAAKINGEIVASLRAGDKDTAMDMARDLDKRGPAAPVPSAAESPLGVVGSDGHVITPMIDGAALVKGGDLPPVQAQSGWVAVAGTPALKNAPHERPDSGVIDRKRPKRSKASQRRYRARKTAERYQVQRGETLAPKPDRKRLLAELGNAGSGTQYLVGSKTEKLMQEIPHA